MAERKAFLLRVDAELLKELEAWAQQELRSLNGQIEYLLRQAVQQRRRRLQQNRDAGSERPTA
ncbi:ribbon-helix-helix domain-containing protein [Limisphaera sp. VF-2]|uniref:ribbon-helix-helix domain-containing protein n=1 Tax=Limisphaera sp. VF-2 TaxID=3400418 RepID=UPI003C19465A